VSYKSILIIKPSSLGDIVHTLPAVAAIREAHPKATITWVINPEWATLLRGNPDIDHVHIFPRGDFRGLSAPRDLLRWVKNTKNLRPDVALDFQGLLRSALIARLSGAREIFGMSDGREGSRFLYPHVAKVDHHTHAVARYLQLAETFGAKITQPLRFRLPTGDELPRFDPYPPFILLHPFARGARKSLSKTVIANLCHELAPVRVVLIGKTTHSIIAPDNCVNLTNQTTLLQLIWLIRAASFVVSVDSGPMHIAAAVTDRLLSIHTWTDPRRVGPYNSDAWVWKNGQIIRVREMERTELKRHGRKLTPNDIPAVKELIGRSFPPV